MNRQPFYHRIDGLMFTSTTGFGEERFLELFEEFLESSVVQEELGIVEGTVEIESYDEPEAGDPSDLM